MTAHGDQVRCHCGAGPFFASGAPSDHRPGDADPALQQIYLRVTQPTANSEEACKQYRIYCLSEKSDMPLLWSHYASAHTGICLEFDTRRTPFSRATTKKVTYLSTYPAYDIVDGAYDSLFTKSADWSYEAEWRLIAEERAFARPSWTIKTDNDFLLITSGVLKAVIIGCQTDKPTQRRIENIIKTNAPGVLVRKATLAREKYELVITPPCLDV